MGIISEEDEEERDQESDQKDEIRINLPGKSRKKSDEFLHFYSEAEKETRDFEDFGFKVAPGFWSFMEDAGLFSMLFAISTYVTLKFGIPPGLIAFINIYWFHQPLTFDFLFYFCTNLRFLAFLLAAMPVVIISIRKKIECRKMAKVPFSAIGVEKKTAKLLYTPLIIPFYFFLFELFPLYAWEFIPWIIAVVILFFYDGTESFPFYKLSRRVIDLYSKNVLLETWEIKRALSSLYVFHAIIFGMIFLKMFGASSYGFSPFYLVPLYYARYGVEKLLFWKDELREDVIYKWAKLENKLSIYVICIYLIGCYVLFIILIFYYMFIDNAGIPSLIYRYPRLVLSIFNFIF
ncbi:MAG: hypothetical protein ACXQS8_03855 [Candidatus Helarchaeales archaeon]